MPEYPEDLSFFKDGKVWLATSSHEEECYIFPTNKEELEKIKNINGLHFSIESEQ